MFNLKIANSNCSDKKQATDILKYTSKTDRYLTHKNHSLPQFPFCINKLIFLTPLELEY